MNSWPQVPIGEVTRIVGGGTPTRSNPSYFGGEIPWVTPKDMKEWYIDDSQIRLTESGLKASTARLVPAGAVLIVIRSGVLKHTVPVALNRRPVAINQDMKALTCTDAVDPSYLARFVKGRSPQILRWVRATTADNFPIDNLKQLRIPLPPIAEQRRIARLLDNADALRSQRQKSFSIVDELARSTFRDMFGDVVHNNRTWDDSRTLVLQGLIRRLVTVGDCRMRAADPGRCSAVDRFLLATSPRSTPLTILQP